LSGLLFQELLLLASRSFAALNTVYGSKPQNQTPEKLSRFVRL
jgi:hypothetical protein